MAWKSHASASAPPFPTVSRLEFVSTESSLILESPAHVTRKGLGSFCRLTSELVYSANAQGSLAGYCGFSLIKLDISYVYLNVFK